MTEKKTFQVSGFKFLVRNLEPATWNVKLNAANLGLFIAALLSLAGCLSSFTTPQPDRTRYFTLTSKVEADAGNPGLDDISLGVGPVRIPGYLDRDQLVTRVSESRFDVSENDRWIEPLDEDVSRVLAQNLYILLKSDRIFRYPWPNGRYITHQIDIEILRFEATAANEAQLSARWAIIETGTKQLLASKQTFVKRPIQGTTKEAAVDALSLTLADFSREIANSVRSVAQKKKS
ncbi:MAG TPA: PqiC family protein [Candidatus Binatia bacterium]